MHRCCSAPCSLFLQSITTAVQQPEPQLCAPQPRTTQHVNNDNSSNSSWEDTQCTLTVQPQQQPGQSSSHKKSPGGAGNDGRGDGSAARSSKGSEAPMWVAFLQGVLDAHQRHCLLWHFDPNAASNSNKSHSSSSSNSSLTISSTGSKGGQLKLQGPQLGLAAAAAGNAGRSRAINRQDATAVAAQAAWPCCWPYN